MHRWLALTALLLAMPAVAVCADDWVNFATVSMTNPTSPKLVGRAICYSDGTDIACDNTAQYISTGGLINAGALQTSSYVSAGTIHTSGTVKVSNTVYATQFVGDGSGLAGLAGGDRIVSGTSDRTRVVAISNTGFISVTQNNTNTAWFDPTRGLVTLGVSATGTISGSAGYFAGNVGIGTNAPQAKLDVRGPLFVNSGNTLVPFIDGGGTIFVGMRGNNDGYATIRFDTQNTANRGFALHSFDQFNDATYFFSIQDYRTGFERLRVSNDGNIGISNTSPLAKLDVDGTISASDAIQVGTSSLACGSGIPGAIRFNTGNIQYCNGSGWTSLSSNTTASTPDRIVSGTTSVVANENSSVTFTTAGSQRMVIAPNGWVGIGTNSPTAALEVSGSGSNIQVQNGYGLQGRSTSGVSTKLIMMNSSNDIDIGANGVSNITFSVAGGSGVARFTNTGLGIGTNGPDRGIDSLHSSNPQLRLTQTDGTVYTDFQTNSLGYLYINPTGSRVGIGTVNPSATLHVMGTVSVTNAVQVGDSSLTCSTVPGAIRYNGGNLQYCNGSGWNSLSSNTIAAGTPDRIVSGTTSVIAIENTSVTFTTAGSQRMVIAPNGWVGIGTNSPTAALEVSASNIQLQNPYGLWGRLANGTAVNMIGMTDYNDLSIGGAASTITFGRGGAYNIRMTWGGLGIGTGDPDRLLDVLNNSAPQMRLTHTDNSIYTDFQTNSTGDLVLTPTGGNVRVTGSVSATNGMQVGQSTLSCINGISGTVRFNTTSNTLQICTAAGWTSLASSTAAVLAASDRIVSGTSNIIANQDRSITFATAGSQRMIVAENGRVGIGTATPEYHFQIRDNVNGQMKFEIKNDSTIGSFSDLVAVAGNYSNEWRVFSAGASQIQTNAPSMNISLLSGGPFYFDGGGSQRVQIDANGISTTSVYVTSTTGRVSGTYGYFRYVSGTSGGYFGGNVGIGLTNPSYALHVSGSIAHTGVLVDLSDRRLKTDIRPLSTSLEQLLALEPVSFRMKDNLGQQELGFIAQDVEKLFPALVLTANDPSATKSMNYIGLIAPMVKGMQELKAENEALRVRVAELEKRLKAANDNFEARLRAVDRRI